MKTLRIIWFYIVKGFSEMYLFTLYMIMRVLKTPCFNLTVDPYASWKWFDDQIRRDTVIVFWLALGTTGYIFLSWWWFLIALGFAILNFGAFMVWLWRKARKDGTSMNESIQIIKGNFKKK